MVSSGLLRRENLKSYNFSFTSRILPSGIYVFFSVGRPPWPESGSVIYSYNCYCVLPALSLSGPSPAVFETISYCLIWDLVSFLSPHTARRATVKVILSRLHIGRSCSLYSLGTDPTKWPSSSVISLSGLVALLENPTENNVPVFRVKLMLR
jgi:hypothetical protein